MIEYNTRHSVVLLSEFSILGMLSYDEYKSVCECPCFSHFSNVNKLRRQEARMQCYSSIFQPKIRRALFMGPRGRPSPRLDITYQSGSDVTEGIQFAYHQGNSPVVDESQHVTLTDEDNV